MSRASVIIPVNRVEVDVQGNETLVKLDGAELQAGDVLTLSSEIRADGSMTVSASVEIPIEERPRQLT